MKMKFWDRMILRIGAVLSFLCGVGTAVCGGVFYAKEWTVLNGETCWWLLNAPVLLIGAGVLVALISLYNLLLPRRYHKGRHAFVVQSTDMGELRIAVAAIENLILKCVETHKEVKVQGISITNRRGAVNVQLRVTMDSNVSIPHAVEQIQSQIKRYLAASSGIEVRDISISVERTEGETQPLPMEHLATNEEAAARAAQPKKEKIPVHQRIFGREEEEPQNAQPAPAEPVAAADVQQQTTPADAAQEQEKPEAASENEPEQADEPKENSGPSEQEDAK